MKNMCKIISIHNVSKNINGKDVLNNIDLEIYKKGISVITGHNGAGKSTLLKIIAGISYPDSGKITYPEKKYLSNSSFIFQKPIFLNRTVKDNLLFALNSQEEELEKKELLVNELLRKLEILHLYETPAKKLSSGEQQLIAFIRAIITKPSLLFLDEPTSNLDYKNEKLINDILLDISRDIKIIITCQSDKQIKLFTDKPIFMQNGMII